MRNVVVTKEYEVYKFNELNKDAKEKVRQWYLEGQESCFFTEMVMEDLHCLFGDNDLEVQYSLGYCQGDGFNIYGEIKADNIFNCIDNSLAPVLFDRFKNVFTEKEKKTILNYQEICDNVSLEYNNRYCYCLASRIDIENDWSYDLENNWYKDINYDVLRKFENMVRDMFEILCKHYEEWGYDYFYEISDEDLEENCEANEYEFLKDGTLFLLN